MPPLEATLSSADCRRCSSPTSKRPLTTWLRASIGVLSIRAAPSMGARVLRVSTSVSRHADSSTGSSSVMSSSVPPATLSSISDAPPESAVVACGALLLAAHDPLDAAHALVGYVRSQDVEARRLLERAGIVPQTVDDFRALFPSDVAALAASASCGAYWALGNR